MYVTRSLLFCFTNLLFMMHTLRRSLALRPDSSCCRAPSHHGQLQLSLWGRFYYEDMYCSRAIIGWKHLHYSTGGVIPLMMRSTNQQLLYSTMKRGTEYPRSSSRSVTRMNGLKLIIDMPPTTAAAVDNRAEVQHSSDSAYKTDDHDFGHYLVGNGDDDRSTAAAAAGGVANVKKPTTTVDTTIQVATIKPVSSKSSSSLMNELKSWRKRTADELLKPPFNVVRNAVIEELVRSKPRTLDELNQLPGVGPVTIQKYGQTILAIVDRYRDGDGDRGDGTAWTKEETAKMDMSFW